MVSVGSWHNPCMDFGFNADSELVTVAEFPTEEEFLVVRALLESEGIECCDPMITSRYHGQIEGGIRLQVRAGDLAAARALLEAPAWTEDTEEK